MWTWIRDFREKLSVWWTDLGKRQPRALEDENRFLTFFRPEDATGLPKSVQRAMAVGTLAAMLALGGAALVSLAGLLLCLFVIYFLATEVLGLDLEVDPRILH